MSGYTVRFCNAFLLSSESNFVQTFLEARESLRFGKTQCKIGLSKRTCKQTLILKETINRQKVGAKNGFLASLRYVYTSDFPVQICSAFSQSLKLSFPSETLKIWAVFTTLFLYNSQMGRISQGVCSYKPFQHAMFTQVKHPSATPPLE